MLVLLAPAVAGVEDGDAVNGPARRYLRVRVEDTGPGVPDAHMPRLFQSRFTTKDDRTGTAGGSGLGLYLSRRAVRQCGGSIGVENVPQGGAAFTVRLPVECIENDIQGT